MISTLAATTVIAIVISGLVSLALVLLFLWRVYERGGRADLTSAARAVRDACGKSGSISFRQLLALLRS